MPKKRRRLDVVCQNASCKLNNKKGKLNIIRAGKKLMAHKIICAQNVMFLLCEQKEHLCIIQNYPKRK